MAVSSAAAAGVGVRRVNGHRSIDEDDDIDVDGSECGTEDESSEMGCSETEMSSSDDEVDDLHADAGLSGSGRVLVDSTGVRAPAGSSQMQDALRGQSSKRRAVAVVSRAPRSAHSYYTMRMLRQGDNYRVDMELRAWQYVGLKYGLDDVQTDVRGLRQPRHSLLTADDIVLLRCYCGYVHRRGDRPRALRDHFFKNEHTRWAAQQGRIVDHKMLPSGRDDLLDDEVTAAQRERARCLLRARGQDPTIARRMRERQFNVAAQDADASGQSIATFESRGAHTSRSGQRKMTTFTVVTPDGVSTIDALVGRATLVGGRSEGTPATPTGAVLGLPQANSVQPSPSSSISAQGQRSVVRPLASGVTVSSLRPMFSPALSTTAAGKEGDRTGVNSRSADLELNARTYHLWTGHLGLPLHRLQYLTPDVARELLRFVENRGHSDNYADYAKHSRSIDQFVTGRLQEAINSNTVYASCRESVQVPSLSVLSEHDPLAETVGSISVNAWWTTGADYGRWLRNWSVRRPVVIGIDDSVTLSGRTVTAITACTAQRVVLIGFVTTSVPRSSTLSNRSGCDTDADVDADVGEYDETSSDGDDASVSGGASRGSASVATLHRSVLNALSRFNISPSQVVGVMCDNATVMDAFVEKLSTSSWWLSGGMSGSVADVRRFRCVSHSLNLISKGMLKGATQLATHAFRSVVRVVTAISMFCNRGQKRVDFIKRYFDITPTKFRFARTRWASWIRAVASVRKYWDAVRELIIVLTTAGPERDKIMTARSIPPGDVPKLRKSKKTLMCAAQHVVETIPARITVALAQFMCDLPLLSLVVASQSDSGMTVAQLLKLRECVSVSSTAVAPLPSRLAPLVSVIVASRIPGVPVADLESKSHALRVTLKRLDAQLADKRGKCTLADVQKVLVSTSNQVPADRMSEAEFSALCALDTANQLYCEQVRLYSDKYIRESMDLLFARAVFVPSDAIGLLKDRVKGEDARYWSSDVNRACGVLAEHVSFVFDEDGCQRVLDWKTSGVSQWKTRVEHAFKASGTMDSCLGTRGDAFAGSLGCYVRLCLELSSFLADVDVSTPKKRKAALTMPSASLDDEAGRRKCLIARLFFVPGLLWEAVVRERSFHPLGNALLPLLPTAMSLLSVPSSNAAAERAFLCLRNQMPANRSRAAPGLVERVILQNFNKSLLILESDDGLSRLDRGRHGDETENDCDGGGDRFHDDDDVQDQLLFD